MNDLVRINFWLNNTLQATYLKCCIVVVIVIIQCRSCTDGQLNLMALLAISGQKCNHEKLYLAKLNFWS